MNRALIRTVAMSWALAAEVLLAAENTPTLPDAARIDLHWGVEIPMRDGTVLSANVYTPKDQKAPSPCIFILTPYTAQSFHDRGVFFAAHGFPFVAVDARGRGNSGGTFQPFTEEAHDGFDTVEWLATQPYCNGKVASSGGSYDGYVQWATAKELPPHLMTIVPVSSPYPGVDFPMFNNIPYVYLVQWLTFLSGHNLQERIHADSVFWTAIDRRWFDAGRPFGELDQIVGRPLPTYHEWLSHPYLDGYWDAMSPTAEQYSRMRIPVLTITGSNDDDQWGALTYYRQHMEHASPESRAEHFLVVGPWNHAGTRAPKAEFDGLKFGPASLVDLSKLHLEWYAWTMQYGPKPAFLQKNVAYYVMGADKWRYTDTLEQVTAHTAAFYLSSDHNASDVLQSGILAERIPERASTEHSSTPDRYIYDPRDRSDAALQSTLGPVSRVDQSLTYAARGRRLVYHSAPFESATEVSGFFRLTAWLAIDQPDTDFAIGIYEIALDGSSTLLALDWERARYRDSLRQPALVRTRALLRYDFEHFNFVSRRIRPGSRLRLVIGPINSMYAEKNYNSGNVVANESMADARPVTVLLYHDRAHPSVLYLPIGRAETTDEPVAPPTSFSRAP